MHPAERDEALRIDSWWHVRQVLLHLGQVPFPIECKHCLFRARAKRIGRGFDGTIENLVRGFEIFVGAIIVGEIYKNKCVLWTERRRFLEIGGGLRPFSLATLNGSNRHVNFR